LIYLPNSEMSNNNKNMNQQNSQFSQNNNGQQHQINNRYNQNQFMNSFTKHPYRSNNNFNISNQYGSPGFNLTLVAL
jgi:hypothetical protein